MATALFVVFAASTFLVVSNAISCSSDCGAIPSCPGDYVLDDCNCSHCAQQQGDECDHPHVDTTRRPLICGHGLKCAKRQGVYICVCERLVPRAVAPPPSVCAEPTPCTAERQVCVATRHGNIECKAANCSFPFPFYGCSIVSHAHRVRTCDCWTEKACASPHEYTTNKECRTALRYAGSDERRRSIRPRCVQIRSDDLACPIDSKLASTSSSSSSSSSSSCSTRPECECNQSKCPPIDCPSAKVKRIVRRKSNVPGTCCPIVACRQRDVKKCKRWQCLWTDYWNDRFLKCPPDSKVKPGETTLGGCCKLPSTCECEPTKCSIQCSLSEYPVLLRRGLGYPGRCCDEYACKPDNSSCVHRGQRYASGSRWKEGCRDCLCFSTNVHCFPPQCPSIEPCKRFEGSSGCCPKCLELASAGAVSFDVPKESGDGDSDSAQVCRERGDVYHKGMWIEDGRMFHTSDKWTRRLRTSDPLTCEGCRCNNNASRRAGSQGDTLCVPCPCLPGCQSGGNGDCGEPASRCNGLCLFTNDEKQTDFFFPGDQWRYKCRDYRCMDDGQITWASVCGVSQPRACAEGRLVDLRDECCEVCSRPCLENITCNHVPGCTDDLTYERNKFGCRKSCTCVKEEVAIQPSVNADCSKEVEKCKPCAFPTIRTKTGTGCCDCVLPDPCKLATCPHFLRCVSVYETTCPDVASCHPRAACVYGSHIVPDVKPTPIAMTPTVKDVRTTTTTAFPALIFPPLIAYTAILINDSYKLYRENDFRNDYSRLWKGAGIDDVKAMAPYDEDEDCTLVEDLADVSQKNRRKRSTKHLIPILITVRNSKGRLLEPEVVAKKIQSGKKTDKIFPFVYVNTYAHFCANYQSLLKPSLPTPVSTEISATGKAIGTDPDDISVKPMEESLALSKILPIAVPTTVIGCVILMVFLVVGFYYCKLSIRERRKIQQSKERKQRKVQLREPQIQDEFEVDLEEEEEQEERSIDIEERRRSNDDTLSISSSFGIEIDENAPEESYTNSVVSLDEEAVVVAASLRDDDNDDDVHVSQLVGSTSI